MHHHDHEQSCAMGKELYLCQHVTDLHRVALSSVRQLDVVKWIEQQLLDAVALLQLFGPVQQLMDGASLFLSHEEDVLLQPVHDALCHGLRDGRLPIIHAPLGGDLLLAELPSGDGGCQSGDVPFGWEHLR